VGKKESVYPLRFEGAELMARESQGRIFPFPELFPLLLPLANPFGYLLSVYFPAGKDATFEHIEFPESHEKTADGVVAPVPGIGYETVFSHLGKKLLKERVFHALG
jgi:hypothetical protein